MQWFLILFPYVLTLGVIGFIVLCWLLTADMMANSVDDGE